MSGPRSGVPVVLPGTLGPGPTHTFTGWPEDVPRTPVNRWAVARAGRVEGHYGPPLWGEVQEDGSIVWVYAFGTWNVCAPCPGSLEDCDGLGCAADGRCNRGRP